MDFDSIDPTIPALGDAEIVSPLKTEKGFADASFISDHHRILIDVRSDSSMEQSDILKKPLSFEQAGPRQKIYFDPPYLNCALATCGGLCPGLNDIIRAIVLELYYGYGVHNISGIRYGLQGFIPEYGHQPMELNPKAVTDILDMGGSVLGSSRGPQDIGRIVDYLEKEKIGLLFMIGGDGTLMAASKIADETLRRGLKISVVGVPKTIDNDIFLISRSFGFDTAVGVATLAIKGAHNEAEGYPNGIGLIKLMGRHSGYIAAPGWKTRGFW